MRGALAATQAAAVRPSRFPPCYPIRGLERDVISALHAGVLVASHHRTHRHFPVALRPRVTARSPMSGVLLRRWRRLRVWAPNAHPVPPGNAAPALPSHFEEP